MSMLRTLCAEGHDGEIVFLHHARGREDWLYEGKVRDLARRHGNLEIVYRTTRGLDAGPRLTASGLGELFSVGPEAWAAVCGPPALLDGAQTAWSELGGRRERLLSETFTLPALAPAGDTAAGTLHFLRSDR
jgi:ferredoxin-NADP reductase